MKKKLAFLLVAGMTMASLAGCGGDRQMQHRLRRQLLQRKRLRQKRKLTLQKKLRQKRKQQLTKQQHRQQTEN